jgi:hypothetical protein
MRPRSRNTKRRWRSMWFNTAQRMVLMKSSMIYSLANCTSRNALKTFRPALAFHYSTSKTNKDSTENQPQQEWRKEQLNRLETKFTAPVESEEELQPMWRAMESRVRQRRPRTLQETGGKTGRSNVKPTEEDAWLEAGLYDNPEQK